MKKVKKVKETVKVESGKFVYLPYSEGTNNMVYLFNLANELGYKPIKVKLLPRNDKYGTVKDTWDKQIVQSFDVDFSGSSKGIEGIAVNINHINVADGRYRRTVDQFFDNYSHIKTIQTTVEKNTIKYMILKPLAGAFLSMKIRTQASDKALNQKMVDQLNK